MIREALFRNWTEESRAPGMLRTRHGPTEERCALAARQSEADPDLKPPKYKAGR
jgi:hypothetical protein